jgi:hypothetical protein
MVGMQLVDTLNEINERHMVVKDEKSLLSCTRCS